jgi:hypothetical protein
MARMMGRARGFGRDCDCLLNIRSFPLKQGKFPANALKNSDFGVLDLALARIVNGGDCDRFSNLSRR